MWSMMLSFILSLSGSKSIPFPSYNPFVKVQVTWFTCDPFSKLLPTSSRTLAITVEWSSPVKTWYFSLAELIWSSYCHAVHVELLFLPLQAISCSMYSLSSNWGISPFAIPPWCHGLSLSYECALAFATLHQTNFLTLHLLLSEGVICLGLQSGQITPSTISIILHMILSLIR